MHLLLPFIFIFALIFVPGWWVRNVMSRYSSPEDRYDGTGGELARHLLDSHDLHHVKVEETPDGDHYDPVEKVIRLTPEKLNGRSLTAVTVAAHEVGHALQDAAGFAPLKIRTQLIMLTRPVERLGAGILMAAPLIGLLTRTPLVGLLMILGGFMSLGTTTLVHLVTFNIRIQGITGIVSWRNKIKLLYMSRMPPSPSISLIGSSAVCPAGNFVVYCWLRP